MTYLERRLASLSEAIAAATAAGPSPLLTALIRRRAAICAALAAPEQAWHTAQPHAREPATRPRAQRREKLLPALAETDAHG